MGRVLIDNPPKNRMMIEITIANAGLWRNFANIVPGGIELASVPASGCYSA
jgi:hypothetical protein